MNNNSFYIRILLLLLGGFPVILPAQTFEEARQLAFDGQRVKARQICQLILSREFNSDVAVLMARTYAWDGKADSTRILLDKVLAVNPGNMDALDAYSDVEYWAGNYTQALHFCDMALKKDTVSQAILFKKAKILHSQGNFSEAVSTLEKLIQINPAHAEGLKKLQEYRLDVLKNSIQLTYTLDLFNHDFNRDPWQIAALAYSRKTRLGTIITRINLADRYGKSGVQGEVDAYPRFGENNYGYLNYGYSSSAVFPKNRLGFEWYHNFPKSFEGSLGLRILQFDESSVNIYTATFGKYIGNYWISSRAFVTPDTSGTSFSGQILLRRYFSDPENYLGLRLGYGISPDDSRNLIDSNQKLALKTRSIRLDYNHIFNHLWILNAGVVWGSEELQSGTFSGYYTFNISLMRLF